MLKRTWIAIVFLLLSLINLEFEIIDFSIISIHISLIFLIISTFFFLIAYIFNPKKDHKEDILEDKPKKKKSFLSFGKILFIIIILFSAIYYYFPAFTENILKNIPILYSIFNFFKINVIYKTYLGLFLVFSLGSLMFLFVPLEVMYLYFLTTLNPFLSLIIVVIAILVGLSFNYLLGSILSKKLRKKDNFEKTQKVISKIGPILLFVAAFTPLPMQILTFLAGGIRYDYKKFLITLGSAILIKYTLLTLYGDLILNFIYGMIPF